MKKIFYVGTVGDTVQIPLAPRMSGGREKGPGEGIYSFVLEDEQIRPLSVAYARNAGIITLSSDKKSVYAANELKDGDNILNGSGGAISAFHVDEESNKPVFLNRKMSYGSRTAYVSVSHDNAYLVAANHGSHSTVVCQYEYDGEHLPKLVRQFDDASIVLYRLNPNGSLGDFCDLKTFREHGYFVDSKGQTTSHMHCVKLNRDDVAAACNRGSDKVEFFRIDREKGKLDNFFSLHVGHGYAPRHADFHPEKKLLYVCAENYPAMFVISYDEENRTAEVLQRLTTMSPEFERDHPLPDFTRETYDGTEKELPAFLGGKGASPSDIHVARNGRFVYVSNRRTGSLARYVLDEKGKAEFRECFALEGTNPRGFNISDDSRYLFVGLNDKNLLIVYELDEKDGSIRREIARTEVPAPASVAIL